MTTSTMRSPLLLVAAFAWAMPLNAQVADAGPDTSLCVNFHTMQGSALPVGATGVWTLVMGCGTLNAPSNPSCPVTDMCIGSNVFVWTVDDNGTITMDTVVITVYDPNMPAGNAGVDQTIIGPQNWAYLSGWPAPIYPATCLWSVVSATATITDPTDPNTMVSGLAVGDNIFCWTCDNGPCGTTSDTVTIQMMMITGLSDAERTGEQSIVYDPIHQQIRVREAAVIDALDVMGMDGRAILHAGGGYRSISTAGLPAGVYLARAVVNGRREVLRFVVGG